MLQQSNVRRQPRPLADVGCTPGLGDEPRRLFGAGSIAWLGRLWNLQVPTDLASQKAVDLSVPRYGR